MPLDAVQIAAAIAFLAIWAFVGRIIVSES